MEKLEQKSFQLELAEQYGDIIYKDNKTLAKLSWLRSWEKNPRVTEKSQLKKLKAQIEELGVYKPLVIYLEKDNGTILGGNQRYKILKELQKEYQEKGSDKYDYVWVSVVNAESDVDKLKYAISDNFSAGSYSREKLREVLKADQASLFSEYQIEFEQKQEIEDLINDLAKSDEQIKLEGLKKSLKEAGVDQDIIEDVAEMTVYGGDKINSDYNEEKIIGTGAIEFNNKKIFVMKLVFAEEQEELYKLLLDKFEKAKEIFKENDGELYQRIISVYGKGKGDVLVKTLHLLESLPSDEEFKKWKEERVELHKEEEKKDEELKGYFIGRDKLL
jgi:hypothetical protein